MTKFVIDGRMTTPFIKGKKIVVTRKWLEEALYAASRKTESIGGIDNKVNPRKFISNLTEEFLKMRVSQLKKGK